MNSWTMPTGRVVEPGDEITITDHYSGVARRFRFCRVEANGDITVWGPIDAGGNTPNGAWRSFKREAVLRKHNKPKSRKVLEKVG